jgi:group I intron endonuclease
MLIYEAYNTKNGKSYIGLTTTTLEKRKSQHIRSAKTGSKMHFHKAIRKHGADSFEWSVAITCSTKERMYHLEQMVIALYEGWQLYNKSTGGEHSAFGMQHTEETKAVCKEYGILRWEGKRATDVWEEQCFLTTSYKEAKALYGVPKTTWYRVRKQLNLN